LNSPQWFACRVLGKLSLFSYAYQLFCSYVSSVPRCTNFFVCQTYLILLFERTSNRSQVHKNSHAHYGFGGWNMS
jgi:hypothetical protein